MLSKCVEITTIITTLLIMIVIITLLIMIVMIIVMFTIPGCLAHTLAGKKMKLLEELSDPAYYHSRPGSMYKGEVTAVIINKTIITMIIMIIIISTIITMIIIIRTMIIIISTITIITTFMNIMDNIQINPGFLGDNQSLAGSRKSVNLQVDLHHHLS